MTFKKRVERNARNSFLMIKEEETVVAFALWTRSNVILKVKYRVTVVVA